MHKFIKIDFLDQEIEISYLVDGLETLPTLLLLHGNSSSSESMKDLMKGLKNSYHVIAVDLPGHGKSEKLKNSKYSVKSLGLFLESFVEELGLSVHALLGHSLGGHLSIQALNTISPKYLITWGTPPMTNPPVLNEMFLANPVSSFLFKNDVSENEVLELYKETHFVRDSEKYLRYADIFLGTDKNFREDLITELNSLEYKDEVIVLNKFEGSIIFIHGKNDKIINKNFIKSQNIKADFIEVENASHYIQTDNASDLCLRILESLNKRVTQIEETEIEERTC
jgi:pimeloyl-ACP methyl ester carboxylesterase